MSSKIKCTYEDCFKHFKSEEAMKKHKAKDPDHFYCKRCDFDAEDDVSYLIHQIEGNLTHKHICCPICGEEFEGTSGRDLHVELRHREKQALNCVGCKMKLMGAAAYIAHIGMNECEVIKQEDWDRIRAERQIKKDAWEDALDTSNVNYGDALRLPSDVDTQGGAPLMDDDPIGTSDGPRATSDLNSRISPLQPITKTSQLSTTKLESSTAGLYVERYPPLPAQSRPSQSTPETENTTRKINGDLLLDFDEQDHTFQPTKPKQPAPAAWKSTATASSRLFPKEKDKPYPSQSDISGFTSAAQGTTLTAATYGGDTQLHGSNARNPVPAAAQPTSNDPNAPFASIRTTTRVVPESILDPMNYWDDIQRCFRCTGRDCKRQFDTAEGFKAHLLGAAHAGGKTQCPSCLKRFKTTWDLVRHCEAPSRRCRISKSANYNQVLRDLTGGLLGVEGHITDDGSGDIRYVATRIEDWNVQEW